MIEGTLIVDQSQDTILVFYARRPDEPVGFGVPPDPVPSNEVDLSLEEVGGRIAPFVPDPAQPGYFIAALTIRPEQTYRLTGRVGAATVFASVVTPGSIALIEPTGDTVFASKSDPRHQIPYHLSAPEGVAWFTSIPFVVFGPDTVGMLNFFLSPNPAPDTVPVTFVGLDPNAAAWISAPFDRIASPNLTGARGVLGAATTVRRVFVWR